MLRTLIGQLNILLNHFFAFFWVLVEWYRYIKLKFCLGNGYRFLVILVEIIKIYRLSIAWFLACSSINLVELSRLLLLESASLLEHKVNKDLLGRVTLA